MTTIVVNRWIYHKCILEFVDMCAVIYSRLLNYRGFDFTFEANSLA